MDDQKRHTVNVYKLHITIYFWKANKKVNLQKMKKKINIINITTSQKGQCPMFLIFLKLFFEFLSSILRREHNPHPKNLKLLTKNLSYINF